MSKAQRSFQPGLQYYVPAMQAASDLGQVLDTRITLGTPKLAAANVNDIAATGSLLINAGSLQTSYYTAVADAPFGRNVAVKASAADGANVTFRIYGRDYLGQGMNETIVVANADAAVAVQGLKAFKYVDKITHTGTATNAVTASVGFGAKLGLPYNTRVVEREYVDHVVGTLGTFVAGILTDPQTATTGDPRGTYITNYTMDGVKGLTLDVQFSSYVNPANNGGFHGIAHFNG